MPCQCDTDRKRARCPNWIGPEAGIIEMNDVTGEQRLATGCFPTLMLHFMRSVIRTNVGAAAAIESHRNVVHDGFARLMDMTRLTHDGPDHN